MTAPGATIEADTDVPIIRITRDFHATPAQLMKAHTDPELFARDPDAFAKITDRLVALETEQTELLLRWEFAEQRLQELGELAG